MKRLVRSIPTNFIRLDSLVTTADTYIDVRNQQVLRLNHNKLLALNSHRLAWHCQVATGDSVTSQLFMNAFLSGASRATQAAPAIRSRILLTPGLKYVTVHVWGAATKATPNVRLYPVLSRPGAQRDTATDEYGEWTATAGALQSIQTSVPDNRKTHRQWEEFDLSLYVNPSTIGANISGPLAIVSSAADSVTIATASLGGTEAVGDIMRFDDGGAATTPYPSPRIVTATGTSGANTIFYTRWPWDADQPVAGTDRAHFEECSALGIAWISVTEDAITDFDEIPNWY